MAGQGTHMNEQLPCQQRNQIESTVCTHRIQLGKKVRKLQSDGIVEPHPAWLVSGGL